MPNLANAKKALRQSKKRAEKNLKSKVEFKDLRKQAQKALEAKDVTKAEELLKKTSKKLDKIAKTGYFKKNKASRLKSRLAKKLNLAKKGSTKQETQKEPQEKPQEIKEQTKKNE